jgi:hypothetical protein
MQKIASILAFIIGAMAIFAGGQVLLGRDPGYYVINWLPTLNFLVGVLTVLFTAILIWKNHPWALTAAIATLSVHVLVMLILLTAYRDVVAPDSLVATTVRIVVWIVILVLLLIQARRTKSAVASGI